MSSGVWGSPPHTPRLGEEAGRIACPGSVLDGTRRRLSARRGSQQSSGTRAEVTHPPHRRRHRCCLQRAAAGDRPRALLVSFVVQAAPFVHVEDIVKQHWATYGRNYYCRYDYEGVDKAAATEMLAAMSSPEGRAANTGKVCGSFTIGTADVFEYEDPVDGSISKNQASAGGVARRAPFRGFSFWFGTTVVLGPGASARDGHPPRVVRAMPPPRVQRVAPRAAGVV